MDSLAQQLSRRVGLHLGADPLIRASDRADFQANGALAAARERRSVPRALAAAIAAAVASDDLIARAEVAGPGFVNLTVAPRAIWAQIARRHAAHRLGVAMPLAGQRVVVEYSGPNIAKELHVGHLRSTVIGDALARLFRHAGADVTRQNHVGDWGTPFGMLIAYLDDHPEPSDNVRSGAETVSRLLSSSVGTATVERSGYDRSSSARTSWFCNDATLTVRSMSRRTRSRIADSSNGR